MTFRAGPRFAEHGTAARRWVTIDNKKGRSKIYQGLSRPALPEQGLTHTVNRLGVEDIPTAFTHHSWPVAAAGQEACPRGHSISISSAAW